MKNILVVAYYFPPAGGPPVQRTLQHVRNLPQQGWNPIVLTVPESEYTEVAAPLRTSLDRNLETTIPQSIAIHRVSSGQPFWLFRLFAKLRLEWVRDLLFVSGNGPDPAFSWNRRAYKKALEVHKKNRIDAVYVSMRPFSSAFIGSKLKRKLGIPLVLDFRDPWTQYFLATFPTWLHFLVARHLERKAINSADHVITTTPTARENLMRLCGFLRPEQVTCITNGFVQEEFGKRRRASKHDGQFRIVYSGNFCGAPNEALGKAGLLVSLFRKLRSFLEFRLRDFDRLAHSPKFLLDALSQLKEEKPELMRSIRFVHVGPATDANKDYAKMIGLESNVEFTGNLSHECAVDQMLGADALFFCLADSPSGDRNDCVPQKTYEYLACGVPVLALVPPGDAKDFFSKSGMAAVTACRDVGEIKRAIEALCLGKRVFQPDRHFISRFERKVLTGRLVDILEKVSSGRHCVNGNINGNPPHSEMR